MNPAKLCGQLQPIMDQSDSIPTTVTSSVPNNPHWSPVPYVKKNDETNLGWFCTQMEYPQYP